MQLMTGDRIYLDSDKWELVGRTFKVLSSRFHDNSTRVELVLEDTVDESILRCVVPESHIKKDPYEQLD